MSRCTPLRIGFNNRIPFATLTADPSPITPVNHIKNEWKARASYWLQPNSDGNIIIEGVMSSPQNSEFFSIPAISKMGDVELKMELYLSPDDNLDLLDMPFTEVVRNDLGGLIPLGEWIAGVDAYGVPVNETAGVIPETFIYWFNRRIYYDRFKLTIRRAASATKPLENAQLRMLFMGDLLELDKSFSLGNTISFLTDPRLEQTSSGSWVNTRRQNLSREINLSLDVMTDRDRNALFQLESNLRGNNFILSAFPSSTKSWQYNNYNMLARFGNRLQHAQRYVQIHQSNIQFLEV